MLVHERMSKQPITITEDAPINGALKVMRDEKVRSLPVLNKKGQLVGIITESDLFKVFTEILRARDMGVRLSMLVPEQPSILADMTRTIADMGGNIISLSTFMGEDPTNRLITVKVADVPEDKLVAAMKALALEIENARTCASCR